MVEPSFKAINWLLRKVRIQPCAFTTWPEGLVVSNSLILIRFIFFDKDRKTRQFGFLIKVVEPESIGFFSFLRKARFI
jgi:hypothetical protein